MMSGAVAARLREIAVRIAPARTPAMFTAVARQALTIVGVGWRRDRGALGRRAYLSHLERYSATDPIAFLTVTLLLATVAAAACVVPVRRALGTDPVSGSN
jgi:hypothetical protein